MVLHPPLERVQRREARLAIAPAGHGIPVKPGTHASWHAHRAVQPLSVRLRKVARPRNTLRRA
jgi:hypothetical protein